MYDPEFQAPTGGLGTYTLQVRGNCCALSCLTLTVLLAGGAVATILWMMDAQVHSHGDRSMWYPVLVQVCCEARSVPIAFAGALGDGRGLGLGFLSPCT